jgi:hypothetical protein
MVDHLDSATTTGNLFKYGRLTGSIDFGPQRMQKTRASEKMGLPSKQIGFQSSFCKLQMRIGITT